ncbi:DUF2147 domain-containing protein [Dyella choica]|uniref:DUF2147 domain-containing protein n=1 Tax=Dyella choica TaxID=1927959 RepID=A0A3S0PRT0_9GAMM|nr:DUF2147 domain-containing protein [Dyella choica]RUL80057.1 DUF2147 domain-containing protein [Dyella choica]
MKTRFRWIIAAHLLLGAGIAGATDSSTPVGTWQQIDDVSGQPKSIIQISEVNGELQGKITQLMNLTPEEIARDGENPVCRKCEGVRKDEPIKGMVIMWGVKREGEVWQGGQILDPAKGKIYKVKLSLSESGQKLDVHGYIGISLLGRSQTWVRQEQ